MYKKCLLIKKGVIIITTNSVEMKDNGKFSKFLSLVERIGNKLPDPFILFFYLTLALMIVSAILNFFGAEVIHPNTEETVAVKSILSGKVSSLY